MIEWIQNIWNLKLLNHQKTNRDRFLFSFFFNKHGIFKLNWKKEAIVYMLSKRGKNKKVAIFLIE